MDTHTDKELIRSMQEGNLEALGYLYDRHRLLVFRTAIALTGDYEAASDLLQDVFMRLYRFSGKIDLDRPIQPWLYRMTVNMAYTQLKREQHWKKLLADIMGWITSPIKNQPAEAVEQLDDWDHIQQAIGRLPFSQRIVVILYYLNDLSLQEISEVLEIPVGTVKSRLYYGRNTLKKAMGRAGLIESDGNYMKVRS